MTASSPTASIPRMPRPMIALLACHVAFRLGVFLWLPLNLSDWPGSLFELAAMSSSSLLAAWLLLGSEPFPWRLRWFAAIYVSTILVQQAALALKRYLMDSNFGPDEFYIFRTVDEFALVLTLFLAGFVRLLNGWRIVKSPTWKCSPGNQFGLKQMFLVTAGVSLLLGLSQSEWFRAGWPERVESILLLHSVIIVMACAPAALLLRPRLRWGPIATAILFWAFNPLLFDGYFRLVGWVNGSGGFWEYVVPSFLGPSVTALIWAMVCRQTGYRLVAIPQQPKPRRVEPLSAETLTGMNAAVHSSPTVTSPIPSAGQ
jgi:hypothetical protein